MNNTIESLFKSFLQKFVNTSMCRSFLYQSFVTTAGRHAPIFFRPTLLILLVSHALVAGETVAVVESESYLSYDMELRQAGVPEARVFFVGLDDLFVYRQIPTYSLPSICSTAPNKILIAARPRPSMTPDGTPPIALPNTLFQEFDVIANKKITSFTLDLYIDMRWTAGNNFVPIIVSAAENLIWIKSGSVPPPEKKVIDTIYKLECIDIAQKKVISSYTFPEDCKVSIHFAMGRNCLLILHHPNAQPEALLLKSDGSKTPVKLPPGMNMPEKGAVYEKRLALVDSDAGMIATYSLQDDGVTLQFEDAKLIPELKSIISGLVSVSWHNARDLVVHYRKEERAKDYLEAVMVINSKTGELSMHRELPFPAATLFFLKESIYTVERGQIIEYDMDFKLKRSVPLVTLTGAILAK